MKRDITDEMIDSELARQERGVTEVEGTVTANLSFSQVFLAVVAANLASAVIIGVVVLLIALAS